MALYSLARLAYFPMTSITPLAVLEVIPSPLSRVGLMEAAFTYVGAANKIGLGFGLSASNGVTPLDAVAFQAHDPADPASLSAIATQWQTPPGQPTNWLRRISYGSITTTTDEYIMGFPRGLRHAVGGSFVLAYLTQSGGAESSGLVSARATVNE